MQNTQQYITTKDLMELYRVTRPTILKWRNEGMPFHRWGTRTIRFNPADVDRWLKEKK